MKVSLKVLILVILVLSLSIIVKPQPGACALPWEYGLDFVGDGIIASLPLYPGDVAHFTPMTMSLTFATDSYYLDPDPAGAKYLFLSGKITLSNPQKTNKPDPFTSYFDDSGKIIITTRAGDLYSGIWDSTLSTISLVLQNPTNGRTGHFILKPGN